MGKMVKCKACGASIAKSASTCPHCGAKQHRGVIAACAIIAALTVFICVLILVSSIGSGDNNTNLQNSQASNSGESTEPKFIPISGTVENWEIKVTDFQFLDSIKGSLFTNFTPHEGCKLGIVFLDVKNNGKSAENFQPYYALESDVYAKIIYGEYEYTSSVLLGYEDDLSNRLFNPLVSSSGVLAFNIAEEVAQSSEPLILRVQKNGSYADYNLR